MKKQTVKKIVSVMVLLIFEAAVFAAILIMMDNHLNR